MKYMKIAASYLTTIILLVIYALVLGSATFIEKYHGTSAAQKLVYYSLPFFLLQFFMIVNFVAIIIEHQLLKKRKWGFVILHCAFVVILFGAMISFQFSIEGTLHLREGERSNKMLIFTEKGHEQHTFPFEMELVKFTLARYPGSASPSSFESEVIAYVDGKTRNERVFMNNVLDIKGYRFFQASYDKDEMGTILSVKKDVAGRNVTYAGYILLVTGFIFCLLGRNSRFRQLSRRLKEMNIKAKSVTVIAWFLLISAISIPAKAQQPMSEAVQKFSIPKEHAEKFGALPVLSNSGRIMPINTFSSEILRKVHKSTKFGQLNSDQFLLSLLAMPDMWARIPLIKLSNNDLAMFFNLSPKECAYIELFDSNGNYKLQEKLETAYNKPPADRNRFDKDLMKFDEQVNIVNQLFNYQLLNIFPKENDPDKKWYAPGDDISAFSGQDSAFVANVFIWYSEALQNGMKTGNWSEADKVLGLVTTYQQKRNNTIAVNQKRIAAEVKYNRLEIFRWCKIGYLSMGGLLLVFSFMQLFRRKKWLSGLVLLLGTGITAVFCYHTFGMGMRWYIAGHAPWSNSYETMVYISWAMIFAGLIFVRRSVVAFALATLFGGIVLFVSSLNWMDPEISPLVPVLKSPWLMIHVTVIMAAYGFFGISCLTGITNLAMLSARANNSLITGRIKELSIINEMSLIIGIALMTIGTFLGAVWANVSWGRYWGWDAKETWALITVIVYAIVIHIRLVKRWDNLWIFNLTSIVAFASVMMTYFGVNYFLSGMHSYGQTGSTGNVLVYILLIILLLTLLAFTSYKGWKNTK
ncbi:MAG: cytochrome c biogenesis protein CcsA [Prevotellaceae bacterium]|jgi:cytochrome c-type biogenesis protein CcsB|nr:cytochrome c biogenesis protein CcsA [Prevotellaceae bacterium]